LQATPKFTQIWIFGLKTSHLATLLQTNRDFFPSQKKIVVPNVYETFLSPAEVGKKCSGLNPNR
jgi:hypothetical protein